MLEELTIRKAVELAAQTEELGTVFYNKLAGKFRDNREIHEIFASLAEDEIAHHKQFHNLLESLPEDEEVSKRGREEAAFLKIVARSEFFMGQSGLYSRLEDIKTPQDALERALQFEKNTWGYYVAMRGALGENEVLDAIIELEKSHITKLVEYLVTGAKMRGLGDSYKGAYHANQ